MDASLNFALKLKIFFKCQFRFFSIVSQYSMEVKFQLDIVWDFCKRNKKKNMRKKTMGSKEIMFCNLLTNDFISGFVRVTVELSLLFCICMGCNCKTQIHFFNYVIFIFCCDFHSFFFFAGETNSKRITFFLCKRSEIAI